MKYVYIVLLLVSDIVYTGFNGQYIPMQKLTFARPTSNELQRQYDELKKREHPELFTGTSFTVDKSWPEILWALVCFKEL